MKWLDDLSDDARSLLEKERAFGQEALERRQRVLARARAAPRAAATLPGKAFWLRPGRLLAASLVLVFATVSYAAWRRTRAPVEAPSVALPQSLPPAPERQRPTAAPEPVAPAPLELREDVTRAPLPKLDPTPASPTTAATYAQELAALEPARAAVARGDHAAALRAIGNHERRFPAGILREEREALRIKALAGLGKVEQARQAAARFRARFPRSVLAPSLDEAVKNAQ